MADAGVDFVADPATAVGRRIRAMSLTLRKEQVVCGFILEPSIETRD
jgi:hypothetical protein